MERIYLSPPHMTGPERNLLEEAYESNWIAPLGPHVDAFEEEFAKAVEVPHAAAVSSGTAALHLALVLAGAGPGDEVMCSTLTFIASANSVLYTGATPVFVDSDPDSWNIDPHLVAEEFARRRRSGSLPKALIAVDLYGQPADYEQLVPLCEEYGVVLVEDAAESLGSTHDDRPVGRFGLCAAFSFNGNKIITTSGGGMLVSHDEDLIVRARHLSTQARTPGHPHHEHATLGFNYRLSNLLAAVGRGQLRSLEDKVEARRFNFATYKRLLQSLPGVGFMEEVPFGRSNRWLSCVTFDPAEFGADREDVRQALEAANIESRPIWMPMHMQPVFRDVAAVGGEVAAALFARALCLPSGSALTEGQLERIAEVVAGCARL